MDTRPQEFRVRYKGVRCVSTESFSHTRGAQTHHLTKGKCYHLTLVGSAEGTRIRSLYRTIDDTGHLVEVPGSLFGWHDRNAPHAEPTPYDPLIDGD